MGENYINPDEENVMVIQNFLNNFKEVKLGILL